MKRGDLQRGQFPYNLVQTYVDIQAQIHILIRLMNAKRYRKTFLPQQIQA